MIKHKSENWLVMVAEINLVVVSCRCSRPVGTLIWWSEGLLCCQTCHSCCAWSFLKIKAGHVFANKWRRRDRCLHARRYRHRLAFFHPKYFYMQGSWSWVQYLRENVCPFKVLMITFNHHFSYLLKTKSSFNWADMIKDIISKIWIQMTFLLMKK